MECKIVAKLLKHTILFKDIHTYSSGLDYIDALLITLYLVVKGSVFQKSDN